MATINSFSIIWSSIRARSVSATLTIVLMAFGVAIIGVMLLGRQQFETLVTNQSRGIDLVVGAKGSPLQIILCNVFHIDFPTGNISLKEAHKLSQNRLVAGAIPLSLGDSYRGFRIVGTNQQFLNHYLGEDAANFMLTHETVVVGYQVAKQLGLSVNDLIQSEHGLSVGGSSHEHDLRISNILPPTGNTIDQLIVTDLHAIWHMHHSQHDEGDDHQEEDESLTVFGMEVSKETYEEEQITSLLVKYRSPMAAIQLPRYINEQSGMQAASPAFETARLLTILDPFSKVVRFMGAFILAIAILSLWISLINSLKERHYELAVMRAIGASRLTLAFLIIAEGVILSLSGCIIGLMVAHGLFGFVGLVTHQPMISGMLFLKEEMVIVALSLFIGLLAAFWPAYRVYKTDLSTALSAG